MRQDENKFNIRQEKSRIDRKNRRQIKKNLIKGERSHGKISNKNSTHWNFSGYFSPSPFMVSRFLQWRQPSWRHRFNFHSQVSEIYKFFMIILITRLWGFTLTNSSQNFFPQPNL